jgi:hypothetical protein
VKKFPPICGTHWFINVFTKPRHLSLSWTRWSQSKPLYSSFK